MPNPSEKSTAVGRHLMAALTTEQIETLLSAAADAGLLSATEAKLQQLDPDLAKTVRQLLAASPPTKPALASSDLKTLEVWGELWEEWADCVSELDHETGRYANHEAHWHPPYFDVFALTEDLDDIARQMLEWIDRAFPLVGDAKLFTGSLREIDRAIQSFPDSMQPFEDRCVLDKLASTCVLRWTWLSCRDNPGAGPKFLDLLYSLLAELRQVSVDPDTCVSFFSELPDAAAREILARLREDPYEQAMSDIKAVWHRIRHQYDQRFDPTAHLRTCREHLGQDWRYGEPLIAQALAENNLAEAEQFVEATLSSLLRFDPHEPWRPELSLIPEIPSYLAAKDGPAILKLVEQWEEVAAKRGRDKRAAVCRLQRALYEHPHDWPSVLEDFDEFIRVAAASAVAEELLKQWRERAVRSCADTAHAKSLKPEEMWVYWVIEARRHPGSASHRQQFVDHARAWLDRCLKSAKVFGKQTLSLALFTRTLPHMASLGDECPCFFRQAIEQRTDLTAALRASIGEALNSLKDATAPLDPMPIWRKHLHTLVPSPANQGYYRDCASWMKALSEINPDAYQSLLTRWKTDFRRRRSLWADMASLNCPGL